MKAKWLLIYNFVRRNKGLMLITFISGVCYNTIVLLIPISIGRFYEFNFGFSSKRLKLLETMPFVNTPSYQNFTIFFIGLIFTRLLIEFINRYCIAISGQSFAKSLREKLFSHQLNLVTSIYDEKGIGKYLLRYSGDLKSIQNYLSRGLFRFTQDVFLICILLIFVYSMDSNLGLVITLSLIIGTILLFIMNHQLFKVSVSQRNQKAQLLSFVNTRLRAISSIKVFNKYRPETDKYNKRSNRLYKVDKKYYRITSIIESLVPWLTYLMLALIMGYIHFLKTHDIVFDEATLLILVLIVISILPVFRRILRVGIIWRLGDISFTKLNHQFILEKENVLPFKGLKVDNVPLILSGVDFYYDKNDSHVFTKLELTINPKETTLILGESGVGKTTLIKLLLKIYEPVSGKIFLGSIDYKHISEKDVRKNISVISNDFPLYGRTVFEAVSYSRKPYKKSKAEALLKKLQEFEDEKNKLFCDSKIGDLGSSLTSGQKKILLISRAMLTNKPYMIIENPFKDLNKATANHIARIINRLKGKKTILIFNPKPVNGLDLDSIVKIANGKITEDILC